MALRPLAVPEDSLLPHRRDRIASRHKHPHPICFGPNEQAIRSDRQNRPPNPPRPLSQLRGSGLSVALLHLAFISLQALLLHRSDLRDSVAIYRDLQLDHDGAVPLAKWPERIR